MSIPFHRMPDPFADAAEQRRGFGRRRQQSLQCNLGEVLDVSRGGLRVLVRGKPPSGEDHEVQFPEADLVLPCNIAWTKRTGFRRYEIGLEFGALDEETTRRLMDLTNSYRLNEASSSKE